MILRTLAIICSNRCSILCIIQNSCQGGSLCSGLSECSFLAGQAQWLHLIVAQNFVQISVGCALCLVFCSIKASKWKYNVDKKPLSFAITCTLCINVHTKVHGWHHASKVGCAVCAVLARCNNSQARDAALPLGLVLCVHGVTFFRYSFSTCVCNGGAWQQNVQYFF